MSSHQSIPLTPIRTSPGEPEYQAILAWPFPDQPFYASQVKRLLLNDIPLRALYSTCSVWVYRDPNGNIVGFGTLDLSSEYGNFTTHGYHYYIPLLAVNPSFRRHGHGFTIVQHLIAEAATYVNLYPTIQPDILFLDVYSANSNAIRLYEKCGFVVLNPDAPIPDPQESNETYLIMGRKVSIATE